MRSKPLQALIACLVAMLAVAPLASAGEDAEYTTTSAPAEDEEPRYTTTSAREDHVEGIAAHPVEATEPAPDAWAIAADVLAADYPAIARAVQSPGEVTRAGEAEQESSRAFFAELAARNTTVIDVDGALFTLERVAIMRGGPSVPAEEPEGEVHNATPISAPADGEPRPILISAPADSPAKDTRAASEEHGEPVTASEPARTVPGAGVALLVGAAAVAVALAARRNG